MSAAQPTTGLARLRLAQRCALCLTAALLSVPAVVGAATADYPPPPGSYPVEPLALPAAAAAGRAQADPPAAPAEPTPAPSSRMLPLPDDGSDDQPAADRLFGAPAEPTVPPPAPATARPYRPAATPAPRSDVSVDSRRRPTTPPTRSSTYPTRPTAPYPPYRGYPPQPAYAPRANPARPDPAAAPRPPSTPRAGNASAPQPAQSRDTAGQTRNQAVFRPPELAPAD